MWIGIGNTIWRRGGGVNWSAYLATLISATVEQENQDAVVLTFPSKGALVITDITVTVNGIARTVNSTSWTGGVWTIILASAVVYGDVVVVTFTKSGGMVNVTNNVLFDYNFDTNLWSWIQPRNVTTLTKDASERIAQIVDLSGNNRHFVQSTDGSKPLWDGTGANCYKKDIRITEALAQPCTMYLVYKLVGWNSGYNIMGDPTNGTYLVQFDGSPKHRIMVGNFTAGGTNEDRNKLEEKQLLTSIFDSNNCESSVDGSIRRANGTGNNTGFNYIRLGPANIIVYELIIRSIHDTEETKIAIWNRLFSENGITLANDDLIVLIGQSNARGRSIVTEITNPIYKATLTNGYIYDHLSAGHTPTYDYELIEPGVNSGSDTFGCFGFEQSLLYHLSSYLSKDVFILKYGQSGTSLALSPTSNDWNIASSGELYDTLKIRILDALKMLMYNRKRGRVKFIIWMQGEQDGTSETYANLYAENLTAFMSALKTYITTVNGYYQRYSDTNIIICKIHTSVEWNYADIIRTAQQNYVNDNSTDTIAIETETYSLMADNKHYTADSSISIGIDIYNAIKDL